MHADIEAFLRGNARTITASLCLQMLGAGATATILCGSAFVQSGQPAVELPADAERFAVGERLVLNGLPMRVDGFISRSSPERLLSWFRTRLGSPLVENTLGKARILGRAQGDHYLTVRIEPAGDGSRGLVATTDLKAAYDSREQAQSASARLLARMLPGSQLLSEQTSVDAGKLSRHVVVVNGYGEEPNRTRVEAMLREDGLSLERAPEPAQREGTAGRQGRTLYFRSAGKEAIATIFRDHRGHTVTVLNSISHMEQFR